jgi:hypothetical protein
MSHPTNVIIGSLAWATALIASAVVFKGNPLGDRVEWFLIIGALSFCSCRWWRAPCHLR